jgi:hypothetical protein
MKELSEEVKNGIISGKYVVCTKTYINLVDNLLNSLQLQIEIIDSAYPDGISPDEWAEPFLLFVKDELLSFD